MERFTTVFPIIVLLVFAISVTAESQSYDFSTQFDEFYHQEVMPIVIQGEQAAVTFIGGHIVSASDSAMRDLAWVTQQHEASVTLPSPAAYLAMEVLASDQLEGKIHLLDQYNALIHEYAITPKDTTSILLEGLTRVSKIAFVRESSEGSFVLTSINYDDMNAQD